MTDARLLNRLAETDAYRDDQPLPDDVWTSAASLQEIEQRARQPRQSEKLPSVQPPRVRRRFVVAATAFAVLAAFVVAAIIWTSDQEKLPDVTNDAPLTPLEVSNALNAAIVSGDPAALRSLYVDDATYTVVDNGNEINASFRHGRWRGGSSFPARPVDRSLSAQKGFLDSALGTAFNPFDWIPDGDPTSDGFDDLAADAMALYAAGVTRVWSCTQTDASTVVCDNEVQGHAFVADPLPPMTDTFTVVEGLITHQEYDARSVLIAPDTNPLQLQYQNYVAATQPELEDALFSGLGRLRITPVTVETHRQLIAEWKAQS